jgi:hypothetical protein
MPQAVLLRWRPSVGVGRFIRRSWTLERSGSRRTWGLLRSIPRAIAREDLRRNWCSVGSCGKRLFDGGALEVKTGISLVRRARAL